jgi:hypothetical protein
MEKKEKTNIRRMINAELKKNFINHPLLEECYGHGEGGLKRSYINSVSCSITYYLLKGHCKIAPEFDYHYIEYEGEQYPDPQKPYYGKYAIDPTEPETLDKIAQILMVAFEEKKENVTDAAKTVIDIITKAL